MSLTDAEILELEHLLKLRDKERTLSGLTEINETTSPNYKLLFESLNTQKWVKDDKGKPVLDSGVVGVVLEGSSRCFHGVQLVKTINGSKPISEIDKGDLVLTFNEKTLKNEYKPVIELLQFDNNKKKCLRVTLNSGDVIVASEDHKFMFKGAWTSLKDIVSLWNEKRSLEGY